MAGMVVVLSRETIVGAISQSVDGSGRELVVVALSSWKWI